VFPKNREHLLERGNILLHAREDITHRVPPESRGFLYKTPPRFKRFFPHGGGFVKNWGFFGGPPFKGP